MGKAEKFISNCTRNCSNEMESPLYANPKLNFYPWLTPDQAKMAVEIAREEIYEWLSENFFNYFEARMSMFEMCLEDLKQAMKNE